MVAVLVLGVSGMTTNPANAPMHLDHLSDPGRARVQMGRIDGINTVTAWLVHGDDMQALHVLNLLSDEHLAIAAVIGERMSSMAAQVLGLRRALPEDVGGIVLGAGPKRAI